MGPVSGTWRNPHQAMHALTKSHDNYDCTAFLLHVLTVTTLYSIICSGSIYVQCVHTLANCIIITVYRERFMHPDPHKDILSLNHRYLPEFHSTSLQRCVH